MRLVLSEQELKNAGLSKVLEPVKQFSINQLRKSSARFTRQNWLDRFGASYRPLITTGQFQLGLYTHNGMFVVCFPTFMMIDFDTDTKGQAVRMLEKWVNLLEAQTGERLLFEVLETDGGIHAFMMSHMVDPTSDDTMGAMLQLKSDKAYAAFTLFRGFCVRLNPKIYLDKPDEEGRVYRPFDKVQNAIVARRCFESVCRVGHGRALPVHENLLNFKMTMIEWLKRYIIERYDYFERNNTVVPSDAMVDEVIAFVREQMRVFNLDESGLYPMRGFVPQEMGEQLDEDELAVTVGGIRGVSVFAQYDQLLSEVDYKACRNVSSGALYQKRQILREAMKSAVKDRTVQYLLKPSDSADVKFLIGYDHNRRMGFIVFGDLFAADWDYSDTLHESQVVQLVRQFCVNSTRLDDASFKDTPLAFRMFETDNGMHALCTSHTFPHAALNTQRMAVSMCSDVWYIAFVRLRGFSLRLTPKVTVKKGGGGQYELDPTVSRDQFVQRMYEPAPLIAARGAKENEALVQLVKYLYRLQRHILRLPNLYERMMEPDRTAASLLSDMRALALSLWYNMIYMALYTENLGDVVSAHERYGCTSESCHVIKHPRHKKMTVSLRHAEAVGVPFKRVRHSQQKALWNWIASRTEGEMPKF